MGKPSLYRQVDAVPIGSVGLRPSPRHWNPGLLRFAGKLWLAYRYHRADAQQRCGTAIVRLDDETLQPKGPNYHLRFSDSTGKSHHEDARLFMFRGQPHISYTEMTGYRPGVDYTCVMKYARLAYEKGKWSVAEEFYPQYGLNTGNSKEKNWVFFEQDNRLYFVYSIQPQHIVVEVDGSRIIRDYMTPGPHWTFGEMRGGSSPVLVNGKWLSIFHSRLTTEEAPHFVRYYAGAYEFEAQEPFRPVTVTNYPTMSGSEEDGHQVDPRYVEGWKPYVVFPCGVVEDGDKLLCSLGINDWQCAVARVPIASLKLSAADGSNITPRYFTTANGSRAHTYVNQENRVQLMEWKVFAPGRGGVAGAGYLKIIEPRVAMDLSETAGVTEITAEEYEQVERRANAGMYTNPSLIIGRR